jgi:TRAP-type C4-dicarboxylate transport system substrate-binding protein
MASVAPEGTAWARDLRALAREVAARSNQSTKVKWYVGGIAGDDLVAADRIAHDQLDGVASGGMFCDRLSPTMHAMHMLVETRDEALFVAHKLHSSIEEEMSRAGFVYLGTTALGPEVVFSREPVRSLADLQRYNFWVWDLDDGARSLYPAMGLHVIALPVGDAYKAYEDRRVDGFVGLPAAALAFQWSAQARYVTDLRMGFISGCLVVAQRAFDQLSVEERKLLRDAAAKMELRMDETARQQEEALLKGGLFARQGLSPIAATEALRREYETTASAVFAKLGHKIVAGPQLETVQRLLGEFRKSR